MNQACAGICLHGQLSITTAPSLRLGTLGVPLERSSMTSNEAMRAIVVVPYGDVQQSWQHAQEMQEPPWHGFRDCWGTLASKRGFQHGGAGTKMERSPQGRRCTLSRGDQVKGSASLFSGIFYRVVCFDPSARWIQHERWAHSTSSTTLATLCRPVGRCANAPRMSEDQM